MSKVWCNRLTTSWTPNCRPKYPWQINFYCYNTRRTTRMNRKLWLISMHYDIDTLPHNYWLHYIEEMAEISWAVRSNYSTAHHQTEAWVRSVSSKREFEALLLKARFWLVTQLSNAKIIFSCSTHWYIYRNEDCRALILNLNII